MTCHRTRVPPTTKIIDLAAEAKKRGKELRYRRAFRLPDRLPESVGMKALDDVYHYVVGEPPEAA